MKDSSKVDEGEGAYEPESVAVDLEAKRSESPKEKRRKSTSPKGRTTSPKGVGLGAAV